MKIYKTGLIYTLILLLIAFILRFFIMNFLEPEYNVWLRLFAVLVILGFGIVFVIKGCADIIEKTTETLSERTKLAGGLLQSFGTAFPDMVLGIVAALISLRLRSIDYAQAINYAIIAAATTFGSNFFNIAYSAWCIFRQNLANLKNKSLLMIPWLEKAGSLKPIKEHIRKPSLAELDTSINVSTSLTVLTAIVALSMVIFGQIKNPPLGFKGDLYQLIRPVGFVIFILGTFILFYFRETKRSAIEKEIIEEEKLFGKKSNLYIWFTLLIAGITILLAAESMVHAIEVLSTITSIPYVITGVLAGIIGCLGEVIVIHNFSVNPNGRIGDAVVGVAMDNIVTIIGASIVAIIGGIFLGGNSLILIFVIILTSNTILIWQISKLKNYFLENK